MSFGKLFQQKNILTFTYPLLILVMLLGLGSSAKIPDALAATSRVTSSSVTPPEPRLENSAPELSFTPAPSFPAPAADTRNLPPDLARLPELIEQRTANSATFRMDDGRLTTIIAPEALHYRDDEGQWQIIDPAFRSLEDSFVVAHNSIRSRAGQSRAWLSAVVNDTAIVWQANTLGVSDDRGRFHPLAEALVEPETLAQLQAEGRVLRYSEGWSDAGLVEEIISAPDSLEHLLILAEQPPFAGKSGYLEMQATLQLWPGATLWADGQARAEAFVTSGSLEIRDAEGNIALVFDPVRAYEQDQPAEDVAGEYVVRPDAEPNTWIVGVRTPWSWWTTPNRRYPAVIDPAIRVLKSTGYGNGMAWVRNTGAQDYTYGGIRLGAHLPDYNTKTRGYVQFNSLPALLSNAMVKVTRATLEVEPTLPAAGMPYYTNSPIDWEHEVIQRDTHLYYIGACPGQYGCPGDFTFHDGPLPANYNFSNSPTGKQLETKPLKAGPASGGGELKITEWDVTEHIKNWYDNGFGTTPSTPSPTFMLSVKTECPVPAPYYFAYNNISYTFVPQCTWFDLSPGSLRLRIEYEPLPLSLNSNPLLNRPGVPSYLPGVFENTNHQYSLVQGSGSRWRAVAARGNHAVSEQPGPPTQAGIQLWDYTGSPTKLASAGSATADTTAYVLIDDHHGSGIATADLKVEVTAGDQNNYPSDQGRNYRLHYVEAEEAIFTNGQALAATNFPSDQLIWLIEFNLNKGDNLNIRVNAPTALDVALIEPATGNGKADATNPKIISGAQFNLDGNGRRTRFTPVPHTGTWALALINTERPLICTDQTEQDCVPGEVVTYLPDIDMVVCPEGSIPVDKFKQNGVSCQPIRLPKSTTPERPMPLPGGGSLTIYSEGDFDDIDATTWCTMGEIVGAPIIDAGAGERWVAVVQGSVCRNGNILYTTDDSAVGLIVPAENSPAGDPRGNPNVGFVYGLPVLPVGPEDGRVELGANGRLVPVDDANPTLRNLKPFATHWQNEYSQPLTADFIATTEMIARASGQVGALVTIDANELAVPINWDVNWWVRPEPASAVCSDCYRYSFAFEVNQDQNTIFDMPLSLASLQVRILGSGILDGKINHLDAEQTSVGPDAFQFQAFDARVTQPDQLGGATQPIKVVAQPPDQTLAYNENVSCYDGPTSTSCLDLRPDDYQYADGKGEIPANLKPWNLPDIHLTGPVGTLAFSQPGMLHIFSTDHPAAVAGAAGIGHSFSFDTWEATVTVDQGVCVKDGPVTTITRGQGFIALPTIGNDGTTPPAVKLVEFKLCETHLQKASLELSIPAPGIPVGSTGLGVNVIGGTITVGQNSTQIELDVDFQTMDGSTLSDGKGKVQIDTAGLLSLQGLGRIVGVLKAETLSLDVAWNPLDLLTEGQVTYGSLVSGGLRMHGWVGQGWQHKYNWLPNDQSFHFSGTIKATVKIPKGELFDELIFKLPPFTITLSATVSFGEFCANSNCSAYTWGLSATVSVLGYDVGLYVDSGGPSLILGSNNHQLVDQFGGTSKSSSEFLTQLSNDPTIIKPGNLQPYLTPPLKTPVENWPTAKADGYCAGFGSATHTCPFTVNPGTGRALFGASWQNGELGVALIKPDNTVIDETNAAAQGVVISTTTEALLHQVSFSVGPVNGSTLMSGPWKLQLSQVGQNLPPGVDNNYSLLFASDPPAPTLSWESPFNNGTTPDGNGIVNLTWTALRGNQPIEPDVKAELFYIFVANKPITPTLMAGNILVNQLAAGQGSYAWDTRDLATGEYAVGARLDDHLHGNGHIVAWAPGTVVINDTDPPPDPVVLGTADSPNGVIVNWLRDTGTPDLAGYLVEYTIPNWTLDPANQLPYIRRKVPSAQGFIEQIRLGGLVMGVNPMICVRAYDASNNVSGCDPFEYIMPDAPTTRVGPPQELIVSQEPGVIRLQWTPPDLLPEPPDGVAGYLVSYELIDCVVEEASTLAGQGPSPIKLEGDVFEQELTDLTLNQRYRVGVRAYTQQGDIGPAVYATAMPLNDVDGDGDGMPDEWEAFYGLTDPAADADNDGLGNRREYIAGANPLHADSDGDSYYDGEEAVEWGTNACSPERPPYHTQPKLILVGQAALKFKVAANQATVEPEQIQILNFGAGTLNWLANASEAWITLSDTGGSAPSNLEISVNPTGLTAGLYNGTVQFTNPSPLLETATIPVSLRVLPSQAEDGPAIFLPMIFKK